jgi:hypothetical protein
MTWVQWLTLGIAVLGAALGVINTWHQLTRNRVRLKVTPRVAFMMGKDFVLTTNRHDSLLHKMVADRRPARMCIEVVNLGCVPVTISDVGFVLKKGGTRQIIAAPEVTKGKTWPTRLEPREAVTAYAAIGADIEPEVAMRGLAYATTDCDHTRYGSSAAMREYGRMRLEARTAQ